jgi:hypothetical protein
MAEAHNRRRYNQGCRCDVCRKAQADYAKQRRQNKTGEKLGVVPSVQVQAPVGEAPSFDGEVLAAVDKELDQLTSTESRPGLAATARALARLLDNPLAMAQHPSAAGKLMEILAELGKTGRNRKGKLAAVIEMTAGA